MYFSCPVWALSIILLLRRMFSFTSLRVLLYSSIGQSCAEESSLVPSIAAQGFLCVHLYFLLPCRTNSSFSLLNELNQSSRPYLLCRENACLHLISFSILHPWNFIGMRLELLQVSPLSRIIFLCCLIWKHANYCFMYLTSILVVLSGRINAVPVTPWWLLAAVWWCQVLNEISGVAWWW
jgi:hypothetical protein